MSEKRELEGVNQMLRDEYQALQLAFASLEEKLRKAQVKIEIKYLKKTIILLINLFYCFF